MITKAIPDLLGMASKKSVSACRPPADAPSPMTGIKTGGALDLDDLVVGFLPTALRGDCAVALTSDVPDGFSDFGAIKGSPFVGVASQMLESFYMLDQHSDMP